MTRTFRDALFAETPSRVDALRFALENASARKRGASNSMLARAFARARDATRARTVPPPPSIPSGFRHSIENKTHHRDHMYPPLTLVVIGQFVLYPPKTKKTHDRARAFLRRCSAFARRHFATMSLTHATCHYQEDLPSHGAHECGNCGHTGSNLACCARCRSMWFCSVKCQKAYWPFHKQWCRKNDFADAVERTEPKFARWMRKHGKQAVLKDGAV